MDALIGLIPAWLKEWAQVYLVPFLKLEMRKWLLVAAQGVLDTLLFLGLPVALSAGAHTVWSGRYQLTPAQQEQVARWASIADLIAYTEDIPPVVPLVLWYKEAGLRAENPANCEGIMGLYTAVRRGELPCFPPGPISPQEVAYQLQLGARTFKSYCPEIHYTSTDSELLKLCYLRYNAGPRAQGDPNQSAYVMNGYDAAHQNMVHRDIQGREYRMQSLGAWPVTLAIQAQLQLGKYQPYQLPGFVLEPVALVQEGLDRVWVVRAKDTLVVDAAPTFVPCRARLTEACFQAPHVDGDASLRPALNPLVVGPAQSSAPECGYMPGVTLTPPKVSAVVAPIAGTLTRYTDAQGHLAVQIENAEWRIWLGGLRSYVTAPGQVEAGQVVGVIGGQGSATPALHYAIYDRVAGHYVDPISFLPQGTCPIEP